MKPHSEASERNREPILKVLRQWLLAPGIVLEIGSGTGQHAVHFAEHLPHVTWVATEREEHLSGLQQWIDEAGLPNLMGPLLLDVRHEYWPAQSVQYVFSANTSHIMSWAEVEAMFSGVGRVLAKQGVFVLYGPFNRDGEYTSESNREFDLSLRARDPRMGVRNDQDLIRLARACGLNFAADYSLPAKNRLLVWTK